jgi:hypothetical protein
MYASDEFPKALKKGVSALFYAQKMFFYALGNVGNVPKRAAMDSIQHCGCHGSSLG